jgi:hypothetical protein
MISQCKLIAAHLALISPALIRISTNLTFNAFIFLFIISGGAFSTFASLLIYYTSSRTREALVVITHIRHILFFIRTTLITTVLIFGKLIITYNVAFITQGMDVAAIRRRLDTLAISFARIESHRTLQARRITRSPIIILSTTDTFNLVFCSGIAVIIIKLKLVSRKTIVDSYDIL